MSADRRYVPAWLVLVAALASACGATSASSLTSSASTLSAEAAAGPPEAVVRLAFAGDVMLGRRLAPVVASDGTSIFEAVRHELSSMDLAVANLESPFGDPAESRDDPPRLVADEAAVQLLAQAGFDAMNLANNHAGDAGTESVSDTAGLLEGVGIAALGTVAAPVLMERNGLRIALLAFDATGQSPAGEVAHWDRIAVEQAVMDGRAEADLVIVSVHGGVEYLPRPDPALADKLNQVAAWGADVVWAHGSHVAHDVVLSDQDGDGRASLIGYGLGNFVFDQRIPGTNQGLLLEVIASARGVRSYRIGEVRHDDLRVSAPQWRMPEGDAAWLDGGWWSLAAAPHAVMGEVLDPALTAAFGEVTASGTGDVDGDGAHELVAAFLRPLRPTLVNQRFTDIDWTDRAGRSAHLGVYDLDSREQRWVAGSVPRMIVGLSVCDGSIALALGELDGVDVVATTAWWWRDFGFATAADLPGPGTTACHDIDADGHLDPVLLRDVDS